MSSLPPVETLRKAAKKVNSNTFLNRELQNICKMSGLPQTGVKAQLQKTIVTALEEAYTNHDVEAFRKLEENIRREKDGSAPAVPQPYAAHQQPRDARANQHPIPSISNGVPNGHGYSTAPSMHPAYGGPYGNMNGGLPAAHRPYQAAPQGPTFHPSPFYQVVQRVGGVHVCQAMTQHRNSITIQVKAQDTTRLKQCADDKSLRVMVFCGAEENGVQDIAFPHQSEMKVNGDDVKANLRGLKGKPGSTRPVDITDLLRLKIPAYPNSIDFTYALTKNKFWLVINICKTVPVEELVNKLSKNKISKSSVIYELTKEAHDDDIELASQVLSLKCPISYMRLNTPIRASTCSHVQCFDATSYLQLQQQGPQWVCPVCSKPAPFERLAIDEYVRDILDNTSESVEQVDIQPDGRWNVHGPAPAKEVVKSEPRYETFIPDDDELENSDASLAGGRSSATSAAYGGMRTPNGYGVRPSILTPTSGSTREGSSMSRSGGGAAMGVGAATGGGATKRKQEVIDLTLSDDDDEPLQPAPKRQQFSRPGGVYPSYY